FVEEDGGYRVAKFLREMVVFARQNILTDPPFAHMDLVSCRNLLIYLDADLQKRILPSFHYALNPGGFLFLGESESIAGYSDLFEPLDRKHKIFAKKPGITPHLYFGPRKPREKREFHIPELQPGTQGPQFDTQREADRITVSRYAPPGVLVNSQLQVLQFRGETSPFLKPPAGPANFQVLKMAREGLMLPLRAALRKAKQSNKTVRKENIRVAQNGSARVINFEVVPLVHLKEQCFLIFFDDPAAPHRSPQKERNDEGPSSLSSLPSVKRSPGRLTELESELAETRDYLQSIQEQYEAANEELQSSNEEVTSANEELQSINEELETSKEELESINEELTTVNDEMASRNAELNRSNADLNNLHASVNMAILVLTRELAIRRFTPQAQKLFNLAGNDAGRALTNVRHNLDLPDLERLLREVIDTISEREREVRDKAGRWYSLRARPYLTLDNKVDGVVLVLVDIDALKRSEGESAAARDYAEAILRTARNPLVVLAEDLRVRTANVAFYREFKVTPKDTEGRLIYELGKGQWNIPELRKLLEGILPGDSVFENFEVTQDFEKIGARTMVLHARRLDTGRKDVPGRILLAIDDITESRQMEMLRQTKAELAKVNADLEIQIQNRTARLRDSLDELEAFSYSVSHDMRAPLRSMQGFADILREKYSSKLDERGVDFLERISRSAGRLDRLIQDVLNYAKVLRDQVPLEPVDLDVLVRDLLETYPEWQLPNATVQIDVPLPRVQGNQAWLTQCFSNLVSNAVKFVPAGQVPQVRIWAGPAAPGPAGDSPSSQCVRIWVEDNGIGISPEDTQRIFRLFERVHPQNEYEGTGIGLTIVRKAVERMGGQIGFESEPGKGTKFWIQLRKAQPSS
ncbi:MAG: two-component system, chemotaxis family, CheB/CheR fusion protein, partial [Verrucomicrobiota bacterium]